MFGGLVADRSYPPTDIVELGALELSRAIHARKVSCREVMSEYLGHIGRVNPHVNAIVSLQPADLLVAKADECDKQLARGQSLGWMHGMPQAVKDLSCTAGILTTYGSTLFTGFLPQHDDLHVARIKAAGAIVIGKTNTPEFGLGSNTYNRVFGVTGNAYDPTRTAGGSSGGAAVALALRMLPVADGSDMMGSLRNPAAYNNIFGFRPSRGRVPSLPLEDSFFASLSTDGPMGRSIDDVVQLLITQAGQDRRAPLSLTDSWSANGDIERDFKGTRIGWIGNCEQYLPMESEVLALCGGALCDFEEIGCHVDACDIQFDFPKLWQAWVTLRHWRVASGLANCANESSLIEQLKPEAQWEITEGLRLTASDIYEASKVRSTWYQEIIQLFEKFDFLVLPSAQTFPFDAKTAWPTIVAGQRMDTYHRWMEVTVLASMAGVPALSVPVGLGASGLPMGMQILGKPRDDWSVLQLGRAYESVRNWTSKVRPSLIVATGKT